MAANKLTSVINPTKSQHQRAARHWWATKHKWAASAAPNHVVKTTKLRAPRTTGVCTLGTANPCIRNKCPKQHISTAASPVQAARKLTNRLTNRNLVKTSPLDLVSVLRRKSIPTPTSPAITKLMKVVGQIIKTHVQTR
jgi:hypothetical protein